MLSPTKRKPSRLDASRKFWILDCTVFYLRMESVTAETKELTSELRSTAVPVTIISAPAFTSSAAASPLLIHPPTMRSTSPRSFFTIETIAPGTGESAPDPASRYTSLMPMNLAARA